MSSLCILKGSCHVAAFRKKLSKACFEPVEPQYSEFMAAASPEERTKAEEGGSWYAQQIVKPTGEGLPTGH